MIHNLQLVGLLFVALFYSSKGSGGINSIVTSLSEFQSVDVGGFQFNKYSAPTLQDTADALFLSSLFGCTDKVNLIGASKFITTLRNLDGGYCDQPGAISDAVSVRNAIVSLSYLGTAIDEKQTEAIGAFLDSLFDSETKLFAPRKGASGDIQSTAVVLEAYERLGLGSTATVTEKKNALKKVFATLVKTDAAGRKYFYSITSDNAYAVIAASLVGFDFGQKEAWAQYFENRQVQDGFWKGGFYSDSDRVDVTTHDATLSVQALYQLYGKLVSTIDTAALLAYANALPGDLRVATQSYKAIARSAAFTSLFKLEPIFATQQGRHRVVNGRIVTGSLVKPSLVVRSNFGIPQSALAVKVSVTFEGEVSSMGLVWDQEHQVYIGEDFFPTEGKLGAASFDYTVQWTGEHSLLSLSSTNAVSIGYWSNVKLTKAISGGNEVEPGVGTVVEYGAAFALTATYGTAEHKTSSPLKQGPFEVILTVVDSSNAEIHRNVLDASKGKPFSFNYQLNQQDIPAGVLTLKVSVKDTAKGIVHTEDSFTFVVHPQMVASNLNFAGDSTQYHIGDRVEITMVPANLPDLKTVLPFTRHPRHINLNVMATSTEVLFSVPGVFNEEAGHYEFSFDIKPTFDSLGAHSVTFSYHAANGDAFGLRLFNSGTNYLYDATENFVFTVLSRLVIQNDNAALKEGQQLQYGNEVAFTFKVFDEISKKNVWAGVRDANAYLVLEHEAGKASAFTSVRESVTQVNANGSPSHFAVQWSVSPNAPSGDAVLALVAQLPSGDSVPMLNSAIKPWRIGVKIGGAIDVTKKSYSGKLNDDLLSFFVEFELSCQGKSLRGAQLSAVVSKDGASFDVPVAIGSHGRYQLSWTQRSKTVSAGDYQINIYRQVDKRSAEALPFRTVIHTHVPPATSPLPVRTEFVILLLLVGSFVWVTFKKMEIQGSNSKQVK